MNISKLFLLSLALLIITSSFMFSQHRNLNEYRRETNNKSIVKFEAGFRNKIENHTYKTSNYITKAKSYNISSHGKSTERIAKTMVGQDFNSTYLIDSLLLTREEGYEDIHIFTYDANGNVISDLWEYWAENERISYYLITSTYDENDNKTSKLWEYWSEGQLVNDFRYTYTWDSNENLISVVGEGWDGSQWINDVRHSSTYDENGYLTYYLRENSNFGEWENYAQEFYTNDSSGLPTSIRTEGWTAGQWVIYYLDSYTYDSNENLINELWQDWDGSQWVNVEQFTNTFDSNGNMTNYLNQGWDGAQWMDLFFQTYTYDPNGNMVWGEYKAWTGSEWGNYYRDSYNYDINGNMLSGLYEYWDGSQWIVANNYFEFEDSFGRSYRYLAAQIDLYYSTFTDVEESDLNVSNYDLSQNFPNPFNPSTTISYVIPKESHVTLKVFDVLGKEVATLVDEVRSQGNYKAEFIAPNQATGIYFYRISAGDFVQTRKMILMK